MLAAAITGTQVVSGSVPVWAEESTSEAMATGVEYSGELCQPTGEGTKESPYQIGTLAELYWFAGLVNGDDSVCKGGISQNTAACAELTNDIDFGQRPVTDDYEAAAGEYTLWVPIGHLGWTSTEGLAYSGTFDGQGHVIKGLYVSATQAGFGFFGYASKESIIKDLGVIDACIVPSTESIVNSEGGGICGDSEGDVINCFVTGRVTGYGGIGGVCGTAGGYLGDCFFEGMVEECGQNSSDPEAKAVVSSIASEEPGDGVVSNCYYSTKVSGISDEYAEALPPEQFADGTLANCLNEGNMDGTGLWRQTLGTDSFPYPVTDTSEDLHKPLYAAGAMRCPGDVDSITGYSNDSNALTVQGGHDYIEKTVKLTNSIGVTTENAEPYTFTAHACTFCGDLECYNASTGNYEISSADELYSFAALVNGTLPDQQQAAPYANAVLTDDIVVNEEELTNLDAVWSTRYESTLTNYLGFIPKPWFPIAGDQACSQIQNEFDGYAYGGVFDGQGHTISGLWYRKVDFRDENGSTTDFAGLFGYVKSSKEINEKKKHQAVVKNVTIENSFFAAQNNSGGIAGMAEDAVIENCHSRLALTGSYSMGIGGIAGLAEKTAFINCSFAGQVGRSGMFLGGIMGGSNHYGKNTMEGCYSYYSSVPSTTTYYRYYKMGVLSGHGQLEANECSSIKNCFYGAGITKQTLCMISKKPCTKILQAVNWLTA